MESGKEHGSLVQCAAFSNWKMLKGSFPWRPTIWLETKQNSDLLMSIEVSVFLVKGEAKNGRKEQSYKTVLWSWFGLIFHTLGWNETIPEHMEQKRALGSSGQPQEETKIVTMKSVDEELHTFLFLLA